ncbi:MAG: hypothetical protein HGA25_06095 [Clostridiales bacterium]|nr:hypothetical protein [Clostridiales bacterium]
MSENTGKIDCKYGLLNVLMMAVASILIHYCNDTLGSGLFCGILLLQLIFILTYLYMIKKGVLNIKKEKRFRLLIYSCTYLTTSFVIADLVAGLNTSGDSQSVSLVFVDIFLIIFFTVLLLAIVILSFLKRNLSDLPAKNLLIECWKNP